MGASRAGAPGAGSPATIRGATLVDVAVEALLAPSEEAFGTRRDVERLLRSGRRAVARRLAPSAHPHAYLAAMDVLLAAPAEEGADAVAVRAFLEAGTERALDVRVEAARWLRRMGDPTGLPVLVASSLQDPESGHATRGLFRGAPEALIEATAVGATLLGSATIEDEVLEQLDEAAPGPRERGLEHLLAEASDPVVRSDVIQRLPRRPTRARKLAALAEVFAWGGAVSRELTGRRLRPHLISGHELGFTRLHENRIYVTPLPLLRGERHGRELVEGLILHEIGHHRHHRGEAEEAVWRRADRAGLGKLLNLVADEHLERNLRAFDAGYGDRLKRLAAYAFRHASRDVPVPVLLEALGGRAFDVLTRGRLEAARHPESVRVATGPVLAELERRGSSFARFVGALRMGLGNRHGDRRVDEALRLFGKGFRKNDMEALLRITRELHRIFGDEVELVEAFGGAESLEDDPWDRATRGEGIDDAEVQQEAQRIQGPPDASRSGRRGPARPVINVGPDAGFDPIHAVERVPPDPESHRAQARRVARHARRLRAFFASLGLALEPQRMRLRGRRFDATRVRPLVTRADPRILVARERRRRTDLHLSLLIDCSGSMQGPSMERAHAFGVLLTEAVRGLRGVDLRIFGFTDAVIFDAGDARRPAVTSLEPGGGNNDAAGLWHAAREALRSPRRARVVVMISDGLPTECSVSALRALVRRLTRRHGLVCAQVAVRPLEERCFEHYVEVDEASLDRAVHRFGRIVADLVGRTLRA
ncbi:MAG TPA: vWA domain-containing protein, partial [Sandaracinaceae bacterium LLY-WYZ-13_1]|nr:vWA domain-containing protein [Sandaracinaceae bacterium LLY-WYZ-13_1]